MTATFVKNTDSGKANHVAVGGRFGERCDGGKAVPANLPEPDSGDARDKAGRSVGVSGKEARDKRIFELWLACFTQEEIAAEVGCDRHNVDNLLRKSADVPKTQNPAALHQADFDVPLYNVWKQQDSIVVAPGVRWRVAGAEPSGNTLAAAQSGKGERRKALLASRSLLNWRQPPRNKTVFTVLSSGDTAISREKPQCRAKACKPCVRCYNAVIRREKPCFSASAKAYRQAGGHKFESCIAHFCRFCRSVRFSSPPTCVGAIRRTSGRRLTPRSARSYLDLIVHCNKTFAAVWRQSSRWQPSRPASTSRARGPQPGCRRNCRSGRTPR